MLSLKFKECCFKALRQRKRKIRFFPSSLDGSVVKKCNYSSYKEIPKAPSVPLLGSLPFFLKAGGQTYLHKYVDNLHKNLGPIFVNKMLGTEMIFISDPDANLQVYSSEGSHPEHFLPDAWVLYLKSTGQKRGLFFMDGEEWMENRKVLNRVLLTQNSMSSHVQRIANVCRDLMKVWKVNPPGNNLEFHLYNWNIECLGEIAIGERLGYLDKLLGNRVAKHTTDAEEQLFVKSIYETFLESAKLYTIPAKLAKSLNLKSWKKFTSAVSTSLKFGNAYVERGIEESYSETNEEIKKSIIYKLLRNENVDEETTKRLVIDLFLASADTTSQTAAWCLYLLGRNPSVAERARGEISSVLSEEESLTMDSISKLKYINGIIRESLRLYPIATFLSRKLAKDVVLYGYSVPAGTMVISSLYTMGRNPEFFTDAELFQPERWFRERRRKNRNSNNEVPETNNFNRRAYIPWGLGGRSCVGKRIAELDLSLLIIEALKHFEWTVEEETNMIMRMVAVPEKNINLNLKPLV